MKKVQGFYGVDVPWRVARLFFNTCLTGSAAFFVYRHGSALRSWIQDLLPNLNPQVPGAAVGILLAALLFYCFCYTYTLANTLHTSLRVRPHVAWQMVSIIPSWSNVTSVLDLGCGRGVLLATIALRLQKERVGGRVVGYDCWPSRNGPGRFDAGTMALTLKRTAREGVGPLVTCKSGDMRKLPFTDGYFNIVFSGLSLHASGQGCSTSDPHPKEGWKETLREVARVLKPKGQLVIWDALHVDDYAAFLKDQKIWTNVKVVIGPSAFLMPTKVLIAHKR